MRINAQMWNCSPATCAVVEVVVVLHVHSIYGRDARVSLRHSTTSSSRSSSHTWTSSSLPLPRHRRTKKEEWWRWKSWPHLTAPQVCASKQASWTKGTSVLFMPLIFFRFGVKCTCCWTYSIVVCSCVWSFTTETKVELLSYLLPKYVYVHVVYIYSPGNFGVVVEWNGRQGRVYLAPKPTAWSVGRLVAIEPARSLFLPRWDIVLTQDIFPESSIV